MQTRFTLRQLEYFTCAAETGSIAAASRVLNVSSPSISTALTQLEDELDTPLFVRKRAQGLSLTEAGRTLAEQASKILFEASELTRLAGNASDSVQGPLRLGCLVSFAQIVVPKLRRSFEAQHAAVSLSQFELTQPEIFAALRRAEIDLSLSYAIDVPDDLEFHPIKTLPAYVMLAPEHPLSQRTTVTIEDLAEHAMVLLDLPLSADYFLSFFDATAVKPYISERTRDMAVARSLVANGFGYSIVNFRPVGTLAPDGKPLVFVPLDSNVPPIAVGVLSAKGAMKRRTCATFLQHCITEMAS
ncbi:LysR family transcriptional regulator [Shimia thalassica]|uniref:LysR family transcriptional regulator n=1 Tax=Shimia thalassica TaxID=1715693 RepID=UPI001C0A098F|nr:LysR family transcriptional regulator [Shimia thalassica]MBU2944784.1 LysR family transcriptional regulator [Shimia thalassica]MDO6504911.1 LysR family transcriptional regulator [Shimia thalassica]